ncbi:MFS transporter [Actinacidiphila soli]|uniref:MFS transporter n=1 Tax=Actinacidiphila soli TaxID=2487275 RepID=UPI0013E34122|nr:MFS transporter [Actinacidiphila soli]
MLRKRSGRTPLIEPSVFTKRAYVSGVVFAIAFAAAMGGTILTLGLFLQVGLGYSALHSSLTTAPWALGALFGSAFGGMRMQQLGRRVLHLGLLLMGGGMLALYGVFQWAGAGITQWDFTAPLLVGGAGMGMIFVPLFDIILSGVDGHEMGSASGALQAGPAAARLHPGHRHPRHPLLRHPLLRHPRRRGARHGHPCRRRPRWGEDHRLVHGRDDRGGLPDQLLAPQCGPPVGEFSLGRGGGAEPAVA